MVSGHAGDGSAVGLNDLTGLFHPWCFYDSTFSGAMIKLVDKLNVINNVFD